MMQEIFFEDYGIGAGRRTIGRTITEADMVLHAGPTGDFHPLLPVKRREAQT